MAHSLSPRAQADIDEIAYYVAVESGSLETADRLLESIYRRFLLLREYPHAGRRRDDLRPGLRFFPTGQYVVLYRVEGNDVRHREILDERLKDLEADPDAGDNWENVQERLRKKIDSRH